MNGGDRAGRTLLRLTATVTTLAALLSGCTPQDSAQPAPSPTSDGNATPSGEPTDAPETPSPQPTLDPDGDAQQNLAYFDTVNERLIDEQETADGRAFIDNLTAAGFDRAAMEVTPDRTAADLPADNIQFSVRMGEECLLGQFGNTGYVSAVADLLSTGKCLVGRTRPIDW